MSCGWFIICIFLCFPAATISQSSNEGVLEKIKNGLEYAKGYLETAKDIANLVSKSLNHQSKKKYGDDGVKPDESPNKSFDSEKLISAFFRLLGLDSPKVVAITVNSAIFLAQMISMLFQNKEKKDESTFDNDNHYTFDPAKFIIESPSERIQGLVEQAQNPKLIDQLIQRVDNAESSCVKLLVCKISLFIVKAQKSLKNKTPKRRFDLTSWLPSSNDFETAADNCENEHTTCKIFQDNIN